MRKTSSSLLEREFDYDGSQLSPHWIYRQTGIVGDAVVAFTGGCRVEPSRMVDVRDASARKGIVARRMLHFLAEHFGAGLFEGLLLQRMLVVCCLEALMARGVGGLLRRGDDLYVGAGKLSVSVASVSPVSALIHLGLNIDKEGSPVQAVSLTEIGVDPTSLAKDVLERYTGEIEGLLEAASTVSPIM